MGKNIYVVRHNNKWATKSEGSSRVGKSFNTQSEAIDSGRLQAIRNNSELTIQGKNRKFREKNSYGNDPKSIKG